MSDIDLLRKLRDDIPEDPSALVRGRRRLLERAVGPRVMHKRRISRRMVLASAGVAAAVTGAMVVIGLPVLDDSPVGARPAAAAVLHEAARNAARAQTVTARPGQYVYTATHAMYVNGTSVCSRQGSCTAISFGEEKQRESWIPVDGKGAIVIREIGGIKYTFFTPGDETALRDAGIELPTNQKNEFTTPGSGGNFQQPTLKFLESLPTDPAKLLARIRKDSEGQGPSADAEALVYIADLLRESDAMVSPELRAALFEAAALIPGIDRVPGQVTLDGQTGVAIGRMEPTNGERQEIIIDPKTSRVLGERSVLAAQAKPTQGSARESWLPIGTVTSWTTTRSAIVDKVGVTG